MQKFLFVLATLFCSAAPSFSSDWPGERVHSELSPRGKFLYGNSPGVFRFSSFRRVSSERIFRFSRDEKWAFALGKSEITAISTRDWKTRKRFIIPHKIWNNGAYSNQLLAVTLAPSQHVLHVLTTDFLLDFDFKTTNLRRQILVGSGEGTAYASVSADLSPDAKRGAYAKGTRAKIYRVSDGKTLVSWESRDKTGGASEAEFLRFSPDSATILEAETETLTLRVRNLRDGKILWQKPHGGLIGWSPNGKYILTHQSSKIEIRAAKTGVFLRSLAAPQKKFSGAFLTDDLKIGVKTPSGWRVVQTR